jgi:hypothetical protein
LVTGSTGCSGTIIAINKEKNWAFGVSCAHCCRVGSTVKIVNPDGSSAGEGRWLNQDTSRDLALFVCWANNTLGYAASIPCDECGLPDWSKQAEGIGYPKLDRVRDLQWKKFKYNTTHKNWRDTSGQTFRERYCWKNHGPGTFSGGDSGGGVFYDGDNLISVSSHGGPHGSTLKDLRTFIKANKTAFAGTEPFG